jgi:hypothetical protein
MNRPLHKHILPAVTAAFALIFFTVVAHSQTAQTPAARQVRIMQVTTETLANLDTLGAQTDVGAVSLEVSLEELRARPAAVKALATWVYEGGVVFLHTDAARIFGYQTVAAREATARVGGQLFGRARAALPFAGHPLLWGAAPTAATATGAGAARSASAGIAAATVGALGVRLVFYQMSPGDHLVLEHPAGVPLLEVTDLALPSTTTQYAAAIAPYGAGWAVFTPSLVEQHRAEGAVFVQNLLRLMGSSAKVVGQNNPAGTADMLASLPASFVENAAERVRQAQNGAFDAAMLGREFNAAWRPAAATMVADANTGVQIPRADTVARLMVTQGELSLLANLLNAAAANAAAQPRAAALIYLLRARLEIQRSDLRLADGWLALAEQAAPASAETVLWRGILLAAQSEDKTLDSGTRATLLNAATTRWTQAVGAPPMVDENGEVEAPVAAAAGATISGIPTSLIRMWNSAVANSARLTSAEPPLVSQVGTESNSVLLRHFANDPTLRLALPAAQAQARSANTLGWQVPEEEILIFPSADYYEGYRRASGIAMLAPANPLTQYGDVSGNRILMVSQMSLPIIIPATPTQPRRILQVGTATPAVLARLHAHVLVNGLAQGGTFVPEWIQHGLMALSNIQVQSEVVQSSLNGEALGRIAAAGGLLSPEQFRGAPTRTLTVDLPEAQGTRLMTFFYERYGAGRVVETLQRLGAGQTIDEALEATVGMNESEFFTAWYNAEFGNG